MIPIDVGIRDASGITQGLKMLDRLMEVIFEGFGENEFAGLLYGLREIQRRI